MILHKEKSGSYIPICNGHNSLIFYRILKIFFLFVRNEPVHFFRYLNFSDFSISLAENPQKMIFVAAILDFFSGGSISENVCHISMYICAKRDAFFTKCTIG